MSIFKIVTPSDNPDEGRLKINYNFSLLSLSGEGPSALVIGTAITGGTPTEVLYTDNDGNLFSDPGFTRDSITNNTVLQNNYDPNNSINFSIGDSLTGGSLTVIDNTRNFTNFIGAVNNSPNTPNSSLLYFRNNNTGDLSVISTTQNNEEIPLAYMEAALNSGEMSQIKLYSSGITLNVSGTSFNLMSQDGNSGQAIITDGSGNLSFGTVDSTGNYLPLSGGNVSGYTVISGTNGNHIFSLVIGETNILSGGFFSGFTGTSLNYTSITGSPQSSNIFAGEIGTNDYLSGIISSNNAGTAFFGTASNGTTMEFISSGNSTSAIKLNNVQTQVSFKQNSSTNQLNITSGGCQWSFSGNSIMNLPTATGTIGQGMILDAFGNLYFNPVVESVTAGNNLSLGLSSFYNPIINLIDSPIVNNLSFSGTVNGNNLFSNIISGGTFYSGSTPLETIISNISSQYSAINETQVISDFGTIIPSSSITMDVSLYRTLKINLGNNLNSNLTLINILSGNSGNIILQQGTSGNSTVTLTGTSYNNYVVNGGTGVINLTQAANAIDIISFLTDGTNVYWSTGYNYL